MKIWGKLFGVVIGFMFGRLFGALLGLWLGHLYDKSQGVGDIISKVGERRSQFFHSTFAVMGHVAKASGRVTENDIRIASQLMDQLKLTGQSRQDAQEAFRQGRQANFNLSEQLTAFKAATQGRRELLQMFLEIQIQTAISDGEFQKEEEIILKVIATELGFEKELASLLARWQAEFNNHHAPKGNKMPMDDAYVMLGVPESASDQEIKRAYRKLMNEHHPDKLVAKGLPEEMMMLAKNKAQDIQAAYERVKADRGMR